MAVKILKLFLPHPGSYGIEFISPDRLIVRWRKRVIETVKQIVNQHGGTGTSLNPASTEEIPILWHRQK
jgi:hypothetical protein